MAYLLWTRGEKKGLHTPQFWLSGIRQTTGSSVKFLVKPAQSLNG